MAEPFLGEVRIFSFGQAPKGWALCNGQQLPINQNQALFALLGTAFGGNGQTTFGLPDLRGRAPVHTSDSVGQVGAQSGSETVTLTTSQMPQHNHIANASASDGDQPLPSILAAVNNAYGAPGNPVPLRPETISNTGGSQPHVNMQPSLTLSFCIALQGIFPSRN